MEKILAMVMLILATLIIIDVASAAEPVEVGSRQRRILQR